MKLVEYPRKSPCISVSCGRSWRVSSKLLQDRNDMDAKTSSYIHHQPVRKGVFVLKYKMNYYLVFKAAQLGMCNIFAFGWYWIRIINYWTDVYETILWVNGYLTGFIGGKGEFSWVMVVKWRLLNSKISFFRRFQSLQLHLIFKNFERNSIKVQQEVITISSLFMMESQA